MIGSVLGPDAQAHACGAHAEQAWIMTVTLRPDVASPSRRVGSMALLFVAIVAAIAAAVSFVWIPKKTNHVIQGRQGELELRADVLQSSVEMWIDQRLADAVTVASFPSARDAVLPGPGHETEGHFGRVLSSFASTQGFDKILVIRANGVVAASTDEESEPRDDEACIAAARPSDTVEGPRVNVHRHASGTFAAAFIAPVIEDGSSSPAGVVILETSPERWLYPFLAARTHGGSSTEAMLMMRDGESVLYLTPLKHTKAPPLSFRRSFAAIPELAALAALDGKVATGRFVDYRGVAVIAVTRRIDGTPWGLVLKTDEAEVLRASRADLVKDAAATTSVVVMLGAVLLVLAISQTRRHEADVARIHSRLAAVLAQANDAILFVNRDGRIEEVNRKAEKMYGRARAELITFAISDLRAKGPAGTDESDGEEFSSRGSRTFQTRHMRAGGAIFPVEISSSAVTIGRTDGFVCIVRDITERIMAEQSILRLSRFHRTRSEINRLIARTDDIQQVLQGACQFAVDDGSFRTAWIAVPEPDGSIRVAAYAGEVDDPAPFETRWDDTLLGGGPTGTAIRENRSVVIANLREDSRFAPWRDSAIAHGFKSCAATPIRRDQTVAAVITRFAADEAKFDNEAVALLEELAADIGFAMHAAENRMERARAEAALVRSEHFRRAITESVPNVLFLFNLELRKFSFINGQAGRLLGYDADQLIEGADVMLPRIVHPDDLAHVFANLKRWEGARDGEVLEEEIRIRDRSDDWRAFHVQETVFRRDDSGRVIQILGSATDLTERREAEAILNQTEERLRALFASDVIGVADADVHGTIFDANDALLAIIGYSRQDLRLGRLRWRDISPPEYLPLDEAAFAEAKARGACTPYEKEYIRKDGTRVWVLVGFTLVGETRERAVGFVLDISMRRAAEMEIHTLNRELEARVVERTAQLEAANRELEAFSYSVSHDLRAPLRAIDGFSRIVVEDHAQQLDHEGHRLLGVVRASARQMAQLIDDLLELSRAGRHEIRKIRMDMTSFVQGAFDEVTTELAPGAVTLVLDELPHATCDPGLIRIVWQNLIANAVKFTAPKPERIVEVGAQRENGRTVYYVRDNGVGFDMQYAGKLFGAFQRLHGQGDFEGTGIGLALVQRIVRRHGGDVRAEGAVDKGATFYFSLPDAGSEKGQG